MTAINMLAKNAVQKPESSNPLISLATSIIIKALMTNAKNPNVTNVNGKVSISSNGLMMAFTKPSTRAEINSERRDENLMPLNNRLVSQSERLMMAQCKKKS